MLDLPQSHKSDLPPSSPTRRARDPFNDPTYHLRGSPPPFTDSQSPSVIYDDKTTLDGHTSASALNAPASTLPTSSDSRSSTSAPLPAPPVPVDNEAVAMDRAAQSLEEAAANQTNDKIQKMLLKKAKKMRKKAARRRGEHSVGVAKGVGGGFVMLLTTPLYVTGAVCEGVGTMFKATGMLFKGIGVGLKKPHTCAMDKLNL